MSNLSLVTTSIKQQVVLCNLYINFHSQWISYQINLYLATTCLMWPYFWKVTLDRFDYSSNYIALMGSLFSLWWYPKWMLIFQNNINSYQYMVGYFKIILEKDKSHRHHLCKMLLYIFHDKLKITFWLLHYKFLPTFLFMSVLTSYHLNLLCGVMVSVLTLSAIDRWFGSRSCQTKDYKIGICCFSAKHTPLRRIGKLVGLESE